MAKLRDGRKDGRLSYDADAPLRTLSLPQADDDLWYVTETGVTRTVDRLRRLDPTDFRSLMSELHVVLKDAGSVQGMAASAPRREEPTSDALIASLKIPNLRNGSNQRTWRGSSTLSVGEQTAPGQSLRVSPEPEPELLSELELPITAFKREESPRRPRLRSAKLVAALMAAFLMLVPVNSERDPIRVATDLGQTLQRTRMSEAQGPSIGDARSPLGSAENKTEQANPQSATAQGFIVAEPRSAVSGHLGQRDIETLIEQGDRFLIIRDITAARSYYERAVAAGSGPAAFALARTFDPDFLAQIGAKGVRPDPERAAAWYRVAADSAMRRAPK